MGGNGQKLCNEQREKKDSNYRVYFYAWLLEPFFMVPDDLMQMCSFLFSCSINGAGAAAFAHEMFGV